MMIKIEFENNKNRATAYDNEKEVGECTFSRAEKFWIIDHTLVDPSYGGQGIAKLLVKEVVDNARIAGVKIVPLCPFALKEFQNVAEYKDIRK